jgi:hypothetical protein
MQWSLLITTLPTQNATARMRAWRALKACGVVVLRDGVYLLPATEMHKKLLCKIEQDVVETGGTAYQLQVTDAADYPFAALFDRTDLYHEFSKEVRKLQDSLPKHRAIDLTRASRKLRSAFDALVAIDFFPSEAQRQTLALLDQLDQHIRATLSPDEPEALPSSLPRLVSAQFQQRIWATRKRPWVDRLASAWLIRRFIDQHAQFLWLDSPDQCPADVLGFDFDGARFTHVETPAGILVTFETLVCSFALNQDKALQRLAQIVHLLDVGGLPVAEAAGLERLLAAMRNRIAADDQLLAAAEQLFDDLYSSFADEVKQHE